MYRVDLHTHTRFFHGFPSRPTAYDPLGARLLGTAARARDLDAVAVTNHDYRFPADRAGVTVIPGIEVTADEGHVLVVGPNPPETTNPGRLSAAEVVALAHDRDCAAIVAHPYRNSTVRGVDAPFDAIEVNGKHPRTRAWAERLATEAGLPTVGGSDAHYPFEVGRAHTVVEADSLTPGAVVDAIRDGRVEVSVDEWAPFRLLRRAYRYVHEEKGYLDRPEWHTPGVGQPPGES